MPKTRPIIVHMHLDFLSVASGRFIWNTAARDITLDAADSGQQFRVCKGRLLQLDRDGTASP